MFKKIGITLVTIMTLLSGNFGGEHKVFVTQTQDEAPIEVLSNYNVAQDTMEWKYLDDNTDPNKDTWYEGWNKRNGWAYPIGWLDYGVDMKFDDAAWPTYQGKKFTTKENDNGQVLKTNDDGTTYSTYYLRHTFRLTQKQVDSIYAITGKVKYNDAMIMYINGKPVGNFFNIPTSNYKANTEYGSQVKVDEYIEEEFLVEDVSSLADGYVPGTYKDVWDDDWKMTVSQLDVADTDAYGNTFMDITIAVELHTYDEVDEDALFELVEFNINPAGDKLPDSDAVKNVSLNVGRDESSLNLAWFATSENAGALQIMEGNDVSVFDEAKASTIPAKSTEKAYTKFTDTHYYSNKVDYNGIEPGKNYVYRVGNADGYSKVYKLTTKNVDNGYEFIFLSDAQIGTGTIPTDLLGWENTLDKALGMFPNVSFIANTGDMVDVANKESEYDAYFTPKALQGIPSATAVGNHDIAKNYGNHFNEPNLSGLGASAANSDYYYTYGNVLYMVLNTSNSNNEEHVEFMRKVNEETKDQDFAWKVVMFHQSIYASGKQSTYKDQVEPRQQAFVPVFEELGVDVVLMGHDHCYARTKIMKNFMPVEGIDATASEVENPDGILYLTTSSASGSKYYDLVTEYEYLAKRAQPKVPMFMHLSFTDDTFTMEAYRTDTLETVDSYTIKKTADTPVVEKPVDEKPVVDTPKDNDVSKPATSPDTGDSTTPMVFALMLLASGMVLGAYKLKRKN
ncbi:MULTISPECIES: metallophosphoesterase family protein [unclassified Breznakia]|uniref:purple acid phosphatase family protein n=1 Tax=unclassified Breznakia TaxID=2623764 RepID=UPI0024730F6A|nr:MULTISPECIES: metallophosphoesterase family protein [unclassified Breznakia]MDH6366232.1 hypothetical protein [Breznakia sp. PH1-1]MDH6403325.1 hypothetical protein [Breznakia sp. PF1-11]MDH6411034.1 hypothetical protein [Breznakia sp. PFB1-11]MDH6413398.1 hypothetical protein [Breznakia sp. PFB1-14]MDH6416163.1 hypothetical protein [Breznakia sp. PFB1-4]